MKSRIETNGALLWALLAFAVSLAGCTRSNEPTPVAATDAIAPEPAEPAPDQTATEGEAATPTDPVSKFELLRKQGRFQEFVAEVLPAAHEQPALGELQLLAIEACLAVGDFAGAQNIALAEAARAQERNDGSSAAHALRLWGVARFRAGQPLNEPQVGPLLQRFAADDSLVALLRFWRENLGDRRGYRVDESLGDSHVELPFAESDSAKSADVPEPDAIAVRVNGQQMPLAFIDTGAPQTVISVAAARQANVQLGAGVTHLIGFRGVAARPGLIERLELGNVVVYDVPVLVGNSAPLVAIGGQMSLGTDLMHHLRFTVDYPRRTLSLARADAPTDDSAAAGEIPLWTFSQACLSLGTLPEGGRARVLVDTGDRTGTFVSPRWARRNLPNFHRPASKIVFKFRQRNFILDRIDLGSLRLDNWPAHDTFHGELERLNLVDLLMGHDLLANYRVAIDLRRRVMTFHEGQP